MESLERWGSSQSLGSEDADHLERLLRSIREQRAEVRLRSRIGRFIDAVSLALDVNFMSPHTNRYRYRLVIEDAARQEARFYKRIALHLVFRSRQLQQLEHKCDRMLTTLFATLADRYITSSPSQQFRLLSEAEEAALQAAPDEASRARLVCDALSRMTDGAATRTWQRLFDADFRSLTDFS
jgi:dGTPase